MKQLKNQHPESSQRKANKKFDIEKFCLYWYNMEIIFIL